MTENPKDYLAVDAEDIGKLISSLDPDHADTPALADALRRAQHIIETGTDPGQAKPEPGKPPAGHSGVSKSPDGRR